MPAWFDHMEASLARADVDASYLFVIDPSDETLQVLAVGGLAVAGRPRAVVFVDESAHPYQDRAWGRVDRKVHMVEVRNVLLDAVRQSEPDVFLSVDSDVLVSPELVGDLLEDLGAGRFDAVGGGTWMDRRDHRIQSCGWIEGVDGFARRAVPGPMVVPMGVIMAIKAMAPAAYRIDYEYNREGEDVGWSIACARAGVRLGWDNRHPSKHVMDRAQLELVDVRCGF